MGGDNPIAKSRILRLRCYRRLGPTAAAPGVRRLFVAVQPYPNLPAGQGRDDSRTESSPGGLSISTPRSTWSAYNNLFDSQAQRPHSLILPIILNVFFDHFGGHFPFLQKRVLNYHVRTGEASSFLLNAISALTARFCPLDGPLAILKDRFKGKWRQGAPFLAKAKDQLASLLSIPASDVVAGLVIMAWVEFGDNNEAGMWMYSGMAIRMAQDLGYHRRLEAVADPAQVFRDFSNTTGDLNLTDDQAALHQHKAQLVLFWTAFSLDVYVSLVTGRPTTLQRNEIDAPIPSAEDMNVTQLEWSSSDPMRNRIFPEVVAFMLHFSESLKILNRMTTMSTASLDGDENLPYSSLREFSQARSNLLGRYKSLPRQLTFGVDTYKRSLTSSQSGLFITLHLFFYTFIILLSRKDPCSTRRGLHNPSDESFQPIGNQDQGDTTTLHGTQLEEQQNLEISRMACQKMAHILTVADVVQKTGYLASPFTNHCFFVAASSILHDEAKPGQVVFRDSFMSSTTENDFDLFNDKLREQSEYFRAIGSVLSTLMQRKNLSAGEDDGGQSTGDEDGDNSLGRVVEDPGIVTRYSIR
uniref:Xylanolytic transcriptional activator regulatory domain-containing protein n=1 Tax=Bionectria ochroleuca TaxID=29856 RepID=A0A8H7K3G1_BIOOC